jgi:ABC-type sulfate/molybdate transport systems ATPase subunit
MVAGLEDITSGEIYLGDQPVNNLPPKDRDMAMVFQNYALYPHMTVYDNMAFGADYGAPIMGSGLRRRLHGLCMDYGVRSSVASSRMPVVT